MCVCLYIFTYECMYVYVSTLHTSSRSWLLDQIMEIYIYINYRRIYIYINSSAVVASSRSRDPLRNIRGSISISSFSMPVPAVFLLGFLSPTHPRHDPFTSFPAVHEVTVLFFVFMFRPFLPHGAPSCRCM